MQKKTKSNSEVSNHGYKSILYLNDKHKQLVLAFRSLTMSEIEANSRLILAEHTTQAFLDTQSAVELSKQTQYALSFTGYSFGAWLAEQSALYCHMVLAHEDLQAVRAVIFESPGSTITQYTDLVGVDVVTYLSEANFVNTCGTHVGKVFALTTPKDSILDSVESILGALEDLPLAKTRTLALLRKQTNLDAYTFYLQGVKAMCARGLYSLFSAFDEATEQPPSMGSANMYFVFKFKAKG